MDTSVPKHVIEGAAGKNDKTEMDGCIVDIYSEKTVQIPAKENTETGTTSPKAIEVVSSDLGINSMEIPVQDGGIETEKKKETKVQKQGSEIGE